MKSILIFSFLLVANTFYAQELGPYGHIIDLSELVSYKFDKTAQEPSIIYKNNSYLGNSLILIESGVVTIENTCGHTPSILRFFDKTGDLKASREYGQTINPETDPSGRYLYFQCNKRTLILDTETMTERTVPSLCTTVNREGAPIYFHSQNQQIHTPNYKLDLSFAPHIIELDDQGKVYAFSRAQYAVISEDQIQYYTYKNGSFFESKTIDGQVYWVEKQQNNNSFHFNLVHKENEEVITEDDHLLNMAEISKNISPYRKSGHPILCPMYPDSVNYPFRIGNSYAEHQGYGGLPYLHPGVDFLGFPQQEIYSPVDGVVKAILTTSGNIHWRLALGLEDTVEEQEGYLFAHLDPATIPFAVGDRISAGDYIGSIVEWPTSEFHHLHFARLIHQGAIWDGDWLTKDNVLKDIINFKDESDPVFEPLWNGQTIAFRAEGGGPILDPSNLRETFDIVCHVHDLSNDEWRLDVDSLWFELIDLNTDLVVYEQEAFSYNFELDTYFSDINTFKILNTIYSTTAEWQTIGNYNEREFYQQVSRSNGDGTIDDKDSVVYFDSSDFPNGSYLIRIHAYDAVENHSFTELEVVFNNPESSTNNIHSELPIVFPNPTTGQFKINANGNDISSGELYNSLGQLFLQFENSYSLEKGILVEEPGVYYLKLFGPDNQLVLNRKVMVQE